MLSSKISANGSIKELFIDGEPTVAMAYTTYFEERSCYKDFLDAGYRIFFVNLSFTTLPINPDTAFSPFDVGVFEDISNPDYSEFEDAVHKILHECPDAIIFPRINISMPEWWVNSHPHDTIETKSGRREIMFSEAFRHDGGELLKSVINHIKTSDYAERICGWMLCGGSTQEWIYRHYIGDLCEYASDQYKLWVKENFGDNNAELPKKEDYISDESVFQTSDNARRYSLFCNSEMAKTIDHFAKITKDATDHSQVVGTFYGYTFEEFQANFGSYALREIIDSPNLDFFSSPNSYAYSRAFGIDWADMMPVDSIKLHGKLAFIECDVRTYLTVGVQKARPGRYPDDIYTTNGVSVWVGPPTVELSKYALRKSFAHQITKGSAIWWFDMWGGWYHDPTLMDELKLMKKIYHNDKSKQRCEPTAEVVFFADEQSYANRLDPSSRAKTTLKATRVAMSKAGAPFDSYMVEDADKILHKYKVAVFPFWVPSKTADAAMKLCEKIGIPYIAATPECTALNESEIREFYKRNGVHIYVENDGVLYAGNGYIAFHSTTEGKKVISLPKEFNVEAIFGAECSAKETEIIEFYLKENDTALFTVS